MKNKLFNKNFLMVVIGQMVSIFGNSVLRFALPLYILDQTGSTAIFGSVLAVSTIPVILFSPIGGILADRVNKRNMMVILDFTTATIISACCLILGGNALVIWISAMMVLLSIIQSLYQPVVQSSIPMLTHADDLEKANGTVSLVNAFSNIMAPVAAGVLYGNFGIVPIMITSAGCFAVAAFMEMFIRIKVVKQNKFDSIGEVVKADFKESIHYLTKENPILVKAMIVVSFINLFLTAMIIIGLPVMIKVKLGLSSQHYGTTQAFNAFGVIVGGILASVLGKKIRIQNVYILLMLTSFILVPLGLSFMLIDSTMVTYWVVSVCFFVMMTVITVFNITAMSFVQRITPKHMIGKVISYILAITQCTLPIGQAIYGYVFEIGIEQMSLIIFATAVCSYFIALYSKAVFGNIEVPNENQDVEYGELLQPE